MSLHPRKEPNMKIHALKTGQLNSEFVVATRLKEAVTDLLLRLSHSACEVLQKEDLTLDSFERLEQKRTPQSFRKHSG
jgi:hypothetical protein